MGSLTSGDDVWIFDRRDRQTRPVIQTRFDERTPRFSPDGLWLAYNSNESGRWEVYVQPYPGANARWQISTDGGGEPVWNPNGREIFYRSLDGTQMMAVPLVTTPSFSAGKPTRLFEGRFDSGISGGANYDVSPDGQRFIMVSGGGETTPHQIDIALNWLEELKLLVAAGR